MSELSAMPCESHEIQEISVRLCQPGATDPYFCHNLSDSASLLAWCHTRRHIVSELSARGDAELCSELCAALQRSVGLRQRITSLPRPCGFAAALPYMALPYYSHLSLCSPLRLLQRLWHLEPLHTQTHQELRKRLQDFVAQARSRTATLERGYNSAAHLGV